MTTPIEPLDLLGLALLLLSVYGSGVLCGVLVVGRPHARASKTYRFIVYASAAVSFIGTIPGAEMVTA